MIREPSILGPECVRDQTYVLRFRSTDEQARRVLQMVEITLSALLAVPLSEEPQP